MGEWWQAIKLYQPMHFFQELEERYGEGKVLRSAFVKGSDFYSQKVSQSTYENGDMKFTIKIIKNGYQVTKRTNEGTIRKFYYDLKKARELL
tara:strand:- start:699 stop:974 length:276 start_codon:yes stop_codon:yes gene_type:complete